MVATAAAELEEGARRVWRLAQLPELSDHLVARREVVPDEEPLFPTVLEDDRAVLGHAPLHLRQELRVEHHLQDLIPAHPPRRLDVEDLVVVPAKVALAVNLAQQVGEPKPVFGLEHRLVQQRGAVAQQLQRRVPALVEVALGIARCHGVQARDVDVLEVAAALRGELLPRMRRAALRARQAQVERSQVRALHVGVNVGASDPPHAGTIRRRRIRSNRCRPPTFWATCG